MSMEVDLGSILKSAQQLSSVDGEGVGGVVGLVVLDDRGLLVSAEGNCPAEAVGLVQSATSEASQPDETGSFPVIVINSQTNRYIIKREEKIITAIVSTL